MRPPNSIAARLFLAFAVAGSAALADDAIDLDTPAVVSRPITLPRATGQVTIRGDLTNYDVNANSQTGIAIGLGLDLGITSQLQLGVAAAFASSPSYGPGDLIGTAVFAIAPSAALRLDGGYEKRGSDLTSQFGVVGLGAPLRLRIHNQLFFVSGDTSAVRFAHFADLGLESVNQYSGSAFAATHADLFTVVAGSGGADVGLNLPVAILWQLLPSIALQLSTGFGAEIILPSGGSSTATEFIPVGLDAIFTLDSEFDLGLGFAFTGTLHSSDPANPGTFANERFAEAWVRYRVGGLF